MAVVGLIIGVADQPDESQPDWFMRIALLILIILALYLFGIIHPMDWFRTQ